MSERCEQMRLPHPETAIKVDAGTNPRCPAAPEPGSGHRLAHSLGEHFHALTCGRLAWVSLIGNIGVKTRADELCRGNQLGDNLRGAHRRKHIYKSLHPHTVGPAATRGQ